jgi:hypothetical protein
LPGGKWVLYHVWHGGEECSITRRNWRQATTRRDAQRVERAGRTDAGRSALLFERASVIFAAPFDPATATVTGASRGSSMA